MFKETNVHKVHFRGMTSKLGLVTMPSNLIAFEIQAFMDPHIEIMSFSRHFG